MKMSRERIGRMAVWLHALGCLGNIRWMLFAWNGWPELMIIPVSHPAMVALAAALSYAAFCGIYAAVGRLGRWALEKMVGKVSAARSPWKEFPELTAMILSVLGLNGIENLRVQVWLVGFVLTGLMMMLIRWIQNVANGAGRESYTARKRPFQMLRMQMKGVRLKDMPGEWFALPSEDAMRRDECCANIAVMAYSRLMDEERHLEALELGRKIMEEEFLISLAYRGALRLDMATCELLTGQGKAAAEAWLDEHAEKARMRLKDNLAIVNFEYAMALLGEQDEEKARQIERKFEELAAKARSKAQVDVVRAGMDMIRARFHEDWR